MLFNSNPFGLSFSLVVLAIFVTPIVAISQETDVEKSRPNVLMIIVDDLNDWVGYLARDRDDGLLDELIRDEEKRKRLKKFLTPNIDRLAASGVAFYDAHCNCPLCGPSRVSLLTGLRPTTSGFYSNGEHGFRDSISNGNNIVTLPQHFKAQGYLTIEAGKVFHLPRGGNANKKSRAGTDPRSWSAQHVESVGTAWKFKPRKTVDGTQYPGNPWTYQSFARSSQSSMEVNDETPINKDPVPFEQRWHKGKITGQYFADYFCWGVLPEPGNPRYSSDAWTTLETSFDYRHADYVARFLSGEAPDAGARFRTDMSPETLDVIHGLPRPEPEQPFFIAYGGHRPHDPFIVPKSFRDALEEIISPDDLDLEALDELNRTTRPGKVAKQIASLANLHTSITDSGEEDFGDRYHHWREALYMYLASVNFADACIGRVMEGYERCPDKDNTIIVMCSDHGWHLGSKNHWSKMTLWQEATHIPLIIKAPGIKPGKCKRTVSLVSVFPTLTELAGLQQPVQLDETAQPLDGTSLVSLLNDPGQPWSAPIVVSYRSSSFTECIAAIDDSWRLIHYKSTGEEELYDRVRDPFEINNLLHPSGIESVGTNKESAYLRLRTRIEEVLSSAAPNVAPINAMKQRSFLLNPFSDVNVQQPQR